jgi:hypothetical protein
MSTKDDLVGCLPDNLEQAVVIYRQDGDEHVRIAGMSALAAARLMFAAGTDLLDSLVAAEMHPNNGTRN